MAEKHTTIAGNYAVSGGKSDPEFVADRLTEIQEERESAAEDAAGFAGTKASLEEKRDQQRRVVDVMDEPVEFRPVGGGVAKEAMELRQAAFNGDDPEAEADLVDLVFDTLAEQSVDPAMDSDWWAGFTMSTIQGAFEELVMSDMDAADRREIEEFRGE
jgi:hypothetical protein